MVWRIILLLTVIQTVTGFNIHLEPVNTFVHSHDDLFGRIMVQCKDGVLVSSNSKTLLKCALNDGNKNNCSSVQVTIPAFAGVKGLKPVVSVANQFTNDVEQSMFCQQIRKTQNTNEDLNGKCALVSNTDVREMSPAALIVDQTESNKRNKRDTINNNNNNTNSDDSDEEDEDGPGTEIGFVLDGSGSINQNDFKIAKAFISTVMTRVWEKCIKCDFTVVQYGLYIRSELLLKESIENGEKAIEKVKNIQQIGSWTPTASAIQYLLNYSFVPENGSNPNAKKIMIVLSDGQITAWDKRDNLNTSLRMIKEQHIISFAIGVGKEIKNKPVAQQEMKDIASNKLHVHFVDDYSALNTILGLLEESIFIGIEGINQGDSFMFQLSEAGFSSHIANDGSLLFGAVGANTWSGGVIVKRPEQDNVVFLKDHSNSSESKFSYLGYSVLSAVGASGGLYISGAPRYNLTGGVFVFEAANQNQLQILQGVQVGSYFGSVLCALDMNKDGVTDYLLVGASSFYQSGEEGRAYVYKLEQGMFHEDFEWQGLEKYTFARFGSAIADVGDLDGNMYADVAVGAPLEEDEQSGRSGSIYIYNGRHSGLQRHFSQRISAADFQMKLRHFGQSISAFSTKKDKYSRQIHISVGGKGKVTVLETLPTITFNPKVLMSSASKSVDSIPVSWQIDSNAMPMDLKICFNTQKGNIASGETLQVLYNIDVDADRSQKRIDFKDKADEKGNFTLLSDTNCLESISLSFLGCIYDCFTPIFINLTFTLAPAANGKPLRVLDAFTPSVVTKKIEFDKDCAAINKCVERISLSHSSLTQDSVIIGSTKSNAIISFNLTNSGDGAYMTTLFLTYPNVMQYSQLKSNLQNSAKLKGSDCKNEVKETISELRCELFHPVFRRDAQASFTIHWQVLDKKTEALSAEITANLTCENRGTQVLDTKTYLIGIKNALQVQIIGDVTPKLVKVTDGVEDTPVTFTFKLLGENNYNATLNIVINITIPAKHTNLKITSVVPEECLRPSSENVPAKGRYVINCTVTGPLPQDIIVTGHASISDVQDSSGSITALASVTYDTVHYELVGMDKKSMETMVEVTILEQKVVKSMAVIIGGSIGGFVVLAILIVILFKCGFFKRRSELEVPQDDPDTAAAAL